MVVYKGFDLQLKMEVMIKFIVGGSEMEMVQVDKLALPNYVPMACGNGVCADAAFGAVVYADGAYLNCLKMNESTSLDKMIMLYRAI